MLIGKKKEDFFLIENLFLWYSLEASQRDTSYASDLDTYFKAVLSHLTVN